MAPRMRLVGKGPSAPARLTIRRLRAQVRQCRRALHQQPAESGKACAKGSGASGRPRWPKEFGAALSAAYDDAASAASACEVSMKYKPPVDTGKKQKSALIPIKKEPEEEPLLVKALDPVTRKPVAVKREIIEETIIIKRKTIIKREPRPEAGAAPKTIIKREPRQEDGAAPETIIKRAPRPRAAALPEIIIKRAPRPEVRKRPRRRLVIKRRPVPLLDLCEEEPEGAGG